MDLGENVESKYGIVEITNISNLFGADSNIEIFDIKEEAEQEADRRNNIIEKIIDKVLSNNTADNSLSSYCFYKVIELKKPKEFNANIKVAFDIDEDWETFNKRFEEIVKEVLLNVK